MKLIDWRSKIAAIIQAQCEHGPKSRLISEGCITCQGMYLDVLATVDEGIDWLTEQPELTTRPQDTVATFRRSIPQ